MKSKICKICKIEKLINEFPVVGLNKDWHRDKCKVCIKQKEYRISQYHSDIDEISKRFINDKLEYKKQYQKKIDDRLESYRKEKTEYQQNYTKKG